MDTHFFGMTSGHLNDLASQIARRHGAGLILIAEEGHDGYEKKRWCYFACPNRGHEEIEANVRADMKRAGGIETFRIRFPDCPEDWTKEEEEKVQCDIARAEVERVIRFIPMWDAQSAQRLADELNEAYELLLEHEGCSWRYDLNEELRLALSDRGVQGDQEWPSPWDEEACAFAWVVDKQGGYLTREFTNGGRWMADKWEAGVDCRFHENCEAKAHEPK